MFAKCVLISIHLLKGGIFTLYEQMLAEYKKLEQKIKATKEQLQNLPSDKLVLSHSNNHYKWYQSDGHTKIYIPKKEEKLAQRLALKNYLTLSLKDLEKEKRAIQFYLKHHNPIPKAELLLTQSSEYQKLLSPYFTPLSQELSEWVNCPYEKNSFHPEHLTNKSFSGNFVRSKSEVIIDMSLYIHRIPFRYECALHLGGATIFPDFTIRHPKTGTFYYWEHFGLMDDLSYANNAYSKLQLYNSHGIIPSIQLITTYETKEHPLSAEVVEKIVEHYFL